MGTSIASSIDLTVEQCLALIGDPEWNRTDHHKSLSIIFALAYGVAASTREATRITKYDVEQLIQRSRSTDPTPPTITLRNKHPRFHPRTVLLTENVVALLEQQLARVRKSQFECLLTSKIGKAVHPDTVTFEFKRRADALALPAATRIADLRWAGIAHAYKDGMPLVAITQALDMRTPKWATALKLKLEGEI